jgi:hypothetical protein
MSRAKRAWELPEDGIVDWIAVALATAGTRPVALTPTEREIAGARILAAGGSCRDIVVRLKLTERDGRDLFHRLKAAGAGRAA